MMSIPLPLLIATSATGLVIGIALSALFFHARSRNRLLLLSRELEIRNDDLQNVTSELSQRRREKEQMAQQFAAAKTAVFAQELRTKEVQKECDTLKAEITRLRGEGRKLAAHIAALRTRLDDERKASADKRQAIEKMEYAFKALSTEALQQNTHSLNELVRAAVEEISQRTDLGRQRHQEHLAVNNKEMIDRGRELYERLQTLAEYFAVLGKGLDLAVRGYNQAVSSLESRVLVTARGFGDPDVANPAALDAPPHIERTPRSPQAGSDPNRSSPNNGTSRPK